ncbi:MAG: hypothetical protein AB2813_15465 [Candidatus Sedimenticola endophacoides]
MTKSGNETESMPGLNNVRYEKSRTSLIGDRPMNAILDDVVRPITDAD